MTRDEEIHERISAALAAPEDSDERWAQVTALHYLDTDPSFDAAVALCESPEPVRRQLGVDILAQLGTRKTGDDRVIFDRPHCDRVVDLLRQMLKSEAQPTVLASIAYADEISAAPRVSPAGAG
ncbi:hypothetical protein [Paraconexibacter algicola]|uniref:HEAT repeat domain-containing protein n=1 Tax=Paraconexibacter algicola TaxID=2133960 RepID=A0A2T4UG38_9ACTN|nr:hypothetical protein [Paraconexibacter algicola]PTL58177.1 hypothetical protein C7Y72_00175 [Paraconexibacter algicola]